ncbi:MAG: thiamine phosphate synthase, partial [Synergistales bacterium]|nr:thiamine phosphate synthase [Synergistales bacterium]
MDPSTLRLYVIPDRVIGSPRSLAEQASLALDGGATAIQLRDKTMPSSEMAKIAR